MADSVQEQLYTNPAEEDPNEVFGEEEGDGNEEEEDTELAQSKLASQRKNMSKLFQRLSDEKIDLRVHDVIIKGNTKTKDSVIESEVQVLKNATTLQELLQAATQVNARLESFDIFDAVNIVLDSGPVELPGTTNVVVKVVEAKSPVLGNVGVYTKPEARSTSLEGTLKLRNLFGYGDIWDGSGSYAWDQASEVSAGVTLPKFKSVSTPVSARVSLLSQDWLKYSSYKESLLGLSLGLVSTTQHDLTYNLTWRTLTDPSQMSSRFVRAQLGHGLISSLKYKFRIDTRDSPLRPMQGYAFVSSTQVAGLIPDGNSLRFVRQEFDLRYAFPLGYFNAALNLGLSVGAIFPWGNGFLNKSTPISERFFLGGQSSAVCTVGGPATVLGFKTRGLGPTELRRVRTDRSENEGSATTLERDVLGGDLACTAYADLSFDLPLKVLRNAGIHGHIFASTGNLTKLTENEFRNLSLQKFRDSFRTSVGAGIIIPTKIFRIEINYCHIVKQLEHDHGKTGIQFGFSTPW